MMHEAKIGIIASYMEWTLNSLHIFWISFPSFLSVCLYVYLSCSWDILSHYEEGGKTAV